MAPRHAPPIIIDVGTLAIALLVIYKHDGNLQRLVEGTEPRFSFARRRSRVTKIAILAAEAGERRWRSCFRAAASA